MNRTSRITIGAVAAAAVLAGAFAFTPASSANDQEQDRNQEPQLPAGWTPEDMQAMMKAGTPGPMHEKLARSVGRWRLEISMWMTPDGDPMTSTGEAVYRPMMDGRYVSLETTGEWEGMGQYNGFGIYGYDNTAEQFQSVWIDNHNTGITNGTGEISDDGDTVTWTYSYHCPINEERATMREIETFVDNDTKTLEVIGADPKSGEEYKMLELRFTRADADHAAAD